MAEDFHARFLNIKMHKYTLSIFEIIYLLLLIHHISYGISTKFVNYHR